MKKLLFSAQFILFLAFNFFLFLAIIEITNNKSAFASFDHEIPVYNGKEDFDPALARLNSISSLEKYCDSIYDVQLKAKGSVDFEGQYPLIASAVVRKRFFHGYSSYSFSNNFMAILIEPLTGKWMSAIVIPDDIMNYPYAACSQQSIVTMELLKRKGFKTRKVGLDGGKKYGGHFCYEAFYDNSWHFFDTDQEPDANILATYNRPGIEFLAKNESVLLAAYSHWQDPQKVSGMFKNYSYGKPNKFEAPNALIYQHVTKFLSYTFWIFLLAAFLVVRRRYLRLITPYNVRNSRISVPSIAGEGSVSYYTKNRA